MSLQEKLMILRPLRLILMKSVRYRHAFNFFFIFFLLGGGGLN